MTDQLPPTADDLRQAAIHYLQAAEGMIEGHSMTWGELGHLNALVGLGYAVLASTGSPSVTNTVNTSGGMSAADLVAAAESALPRV
jgi:hypothetical protein